nr:polysaccharide deacetylase family protein [Streptomyces boncukensis]
MPEQPDRRSLLRLAALAAGATAAAGGLASRQALALNRGPDDAPPFAGRPPVTGTLAGQDITTLPVTERKVALTFDCGGSPDGAEDVLATLDTYAVPATFFMTGRFALDYTATARRIARRHPLGNHSMTHPEFPELTPHQRLREIRAADRSITAATGRRPEPLFRFPYGERTRECVTEVNDEGFVCVRWTVDTLGWKGAAEGVTTRTVIDRVLEALTPGAIVLMHVGSTSEADPSTVDVTALPRLIEALTAEGYGCTSLDALTPR